MICFINILLENFTPVQDVLIQKSFFLMRATKISLSELSKKCDSNRRISIPKLFFLRNYRFSYFHQDSTQRFLLLRGALEKLRFPLLASESCWSKICQKHFFNSLRYPNSHFSVTTEEISFMKVSIDKFLVWKTF